MKVGLASKDGNYINKVQLYLSVIKAAIIFLSVLSLLILIKLMLKLIKYSHPNILYSIPLLKNKTILHFSSPGKYKIAILGARFVSNSEKLNIELTHMTNNDKIGITSLSNIPMFPNIKKNGHWGAIIKHCTIEKTGDYQFVSEGSELLELKISNRNSLVPFTTKSILAEDAEFIIFKQEKLPYLLIGLLVICIVAIGLIMNING